MLEAVVGDVVVGVDGSGNAQEAVAWAAADAERRGARLCLVHAYVPRSQQYPYNMVEPDALKEVANTERVLAEDLVASLATRVRDAHPVEVVTDVVVGDPSEALIDRSSEADLIVVGSRGLGGITGLLLGSVSQRVVQHARCPVVVVPSS